jgi:hypothetical protein
MTRRTGVPSALGVPFNLGGQPVVIGLMWVVFLVALFRFGRKSGNDNHCCAAVDSIRRFSSLTAADIDRAPPPACRLPATSQARPGQARPGCGWTYQGSDRFPARRVSTASSGTATTLPPDSPHGARSTSHLTSVPHAADPPGVPSAAG